MNDCTGAYLAQAGARLERLALAERGILSNRPIC